MVLKGQECLLTRDLFVTSTLRFGGCRIYYKMKYLYDIYRHDCLEQKCTLINIISPVSINGNLGITPPGPVNKNKNLSRTRHGIGFSLKKLKFSSERR